MTGWCLFVHSYARACASHVSVCVCVLDVCLIVIQCCRAVTVHVRWKHFKFEQQLRRCLFTFYLSACQVPCLHSSLALPHSSTVHVIKTSNCHAHLRTLVRQYITSLNICNDWSSGRWTRFMERGSCNEHFHDKGSASMTTATASQLVTT